MTVLGWDELVEVVPECQAVVGKLAYLKGIGAGAQSIPGEWI